MENMPRYANMTLGSLRRQESLMLLVMSLFLYGIGVFKMGDAKDLLDLLSAGGDIFIIVIGLALFRIDKRLSRVELIQSFASDNAKKDLTNNAP